MLIWTPGEYTFELRGWGDGPSGSPPFNVKTRFKARIGVLEANQMKYWSNASKTEWDQLNDPDRVVGIPVRIDEYSVASA